MSTVYTTTMNQNTGKKKFKCQNICIWIKSCNCELMEIISTLKEKLQSWWTSLIFYNGNSKILILTQVLLFQQDLKIQSPTWFGKFGTWLSDSIVELTFSHPHCPSWLQWVGKSKGVFFLTKMTPLIAIFSDKILK